MGRGSAMMAVSPDDRPASIRRLVDRIETAGRRLRADERVLSGRLRSIGGSVPAWIDPTGVSDAGLAAALGDGAAPASDDQPGARPRDRALRPARALARPGDRRPPARWPLAPGRWLEPISSTVPGRPGSIPADGATPGPLGPRVGDESPAMDSAGARPPAATSAAPVWNPGRATGPVVIEAGWSDLPAVRRLLDPPEPGRRTEGTDGRSSTTQSPYPSAPGPAPVDGGGRPSPAPAMAEAEVRRGGALADRAAVEPTVRPDRPTAGPASPPRSGRPARRLETATTGGSSEAPDLGAWPTERGPVRSLADLARMGSESDADVTDCPPSPAAVDPGPARTLSAALAPTPAPSAGLDRRPSSSATAWPDPVGPDLAVDLAGLVGAAVEEEARRQGIDLDGVHR